jgi:hypothetical protein
MLRWETNKCINYFLGSSQNRVLFKAGAYTLQGADGSFIASSGTTGETRLITPRDG